MQKRGVVTGGLIVACAVALAACNAVDSMKEGFAHSMDVAADLEKSIGSKPFVGFNWNNGQLTSVNVTFDGIPQNANLQDITEKSRQAIAAEFKQKPQHIVIGFSVGP